MLFDIVVVGITLLARLFN